MKLVLIGGDRIWLARIRDALSKAGHQVEIGHDLADAEILLRATSAGVLLVDVEPDVGPEDVQALEGLIESWPELEVIVVLADMAVYEEEQIIEATRTVGVNLHLPRRFVASPYFNSVLTLVANSRRPGRLATSAGDELERTSAADAERPVTIPDYSVLQETLRRELEAGTELSLMMIGIDNLREIEQKRGEEPAAQALEDLTALLVADLRQNDVVTQTPDRDRLAVLLPLTDAASASKIARRIQDKLARRSLGVISVSAGIAAAEEGVDAQTLITWTREAWQRARRRDDRLAVLSERT